MYKRIAIPIVRLVAVLAVLLGGLVPGPAYAALGPPATGPGDVPDYYSTPNWAFSPGLRKFVDALPGIPVAVPDIVSYPGTDYYEIELNQYSQMMHRDLVNPTTLRGYEQTNSGTNITNPATLQCGAGTVPDPYRACVLSDNTVAPAARSYLGPLIIANKNRPVRVKFTNAIPLEGDTPVSGKLFVPVDTSIMGSGEYNIDFDPVNKLDDNTVRLGHFTENRATLHLHGGRTPWISDGTPHQWITPAGETDAGDYVQGVSVVNVPDMPAPVPGDGTQTFYWTNQQSARLMFYHDHAWGITRLNVYVGEAAGYLITDDMEQTLIGPGGPLADVSYGTPLVIQDKTFVDATTIAATDPTWNWGTGAENKGEITSITVIKDPVTYTTYTTPIVTITEGANTTATAVAVQNAAGDIVRIDVTAGGTGFVNPVVTITDSTGTGTGATATAVVTDTRTPKTGDLWWPHVYMPAQNPFNPDFSGINAMGRWHYGPWFWPPTPLCGTNNAVPPWCVDFIETANPYYDCYYTGELKAFPPYDAYTSDGLCNYPDQPPYIPGTPNVSWGAEAFLDTVIVNGKAFPVTEVDPKQYRFRVLNASHDRFMNLQFYQAVSMSGYTNPTAGLNYVEDPGYPTTADTVLTEVAMVPAAAGTPNFPESWPVDGREGGVPNPDSRGPAFIQIGTEGGFLPAPVLLNNQPVQWNLDPTMFNVGNVLQVRDGGGTVILGPAERADVIVDFSKYAGKTLILYNDAPTAFPALDPHYDYYTGAPDRTDIGANTEILPGYGPNIRTVMQIKVRATCDPLNTRCDSTAPVNDYNQATLDALTAAFKPGGLTPFATHQDPIIVGQKEYGNAPGQTGAYNIAFPATFPNWGVSRISDTLLKYMSPTDGLIKNMHMLPKSIHDEMGGSFDNYGRMSAKLGLEVPSSTAAISTFALQNYVDPPTEIYPDPNPLTLNPEGVQIWKITHNGVDTHPIHFHLFDVQVINRVGWDGFIRKPDANELGWKDTVRIAPLEDTIVALKPIVPMVPFGLPNSWRPLNPETPLGSGMGFSNINPLTGGALADPTLNGFYDFGWEYVWHCHILSHEENDMMRSLVFNVTTAAPLSPAPLAATLSAPGGLLQVDLEWTDAMSTPGDPANEIGFVLERAIGNGAFVPLPPTAPSPTIVPANSTTYADTTAPGGSTLHYRVQTFNAFGVSAWATATIVTPSPLAISTGSPLPAASTSAFYWNMLTATGGLAPYSWALAAGSQLPAGLSVFNSTNPAACGIGGRPTVPGDYSFTIQATDALGVSATKTFALSISGTTLSITNANTMPGGTTGVFYNTTLAATGGSQPYTWSVVGGSVNLPPGLTLNASTGILAGRPTVVNNFGFTIRVTDGSAVSVEKAFTLNVIAGSLVITNGPTMPSGTVGAFYAVRLAATGGSQAFSWSVVGGSVNLPPGLTLNASTGWLAGRPTIANLYSFTIRVTDALGVFTDKLFSLQVN
jgi:FtsP/CotA-like multicopper oxidase with cupredoxin domain